MRQKRVAYSEAVARRVCAAWAAGESLRAMSRQDGMPNQCTVRAWARERPGFRAMWEEARAARAALFEREPGLAKRAAGHLGPRPGYDAAAAARVCARLMAGESLRALAADRSLPSVQTIYNWLAQHEDFRLAYRAACDVRAEGLMEELLLIADDDAEDLIEQPDGRIEPNLQAIRRARLMMEARRRWAELTRPRQDYGPGLAAGGGEGGGGRDGRGARAGMTCEDLMELMDELEGTAEARAQAADEAAWDGFVGRGAGEEGEG